MKSNSELTRRGEILERYIADNLTQLLPGFKVVGRNVHIANSTFDMQIKDAKGMDYFIKVKAAKCNRLSIGQIVEYKSRLAKTKPDARIILVCEGVTAQVKDMLEKIGIEVQTFADLKIPDEIINYQDTKPNAIRLSPVEQKAYFALLKRGSIVAKPKDLAATLNVSYAWAKNILSKLARDGAAQRIGKGKYIIIPADVVYGRKSYIADPLMLVSELLKGTDYYVAYYSAAHIHGITEQMPYKVTVAVHKQLRPIKAGNIHMNFINLKKSRFFGYEEIKYMDSYLNVSDTEKTIIDCIHRQELCGGVAEVIRTLMNAAEAEKVNWQKLVHYVKRFESPILAQRIGFISELLKERKKIQVPQEILDELLALTSSKIYLLDSKVPRQGEISRKWRIINNAEVIEI